ncbi:MAG: AbrB/MazE/SpoVT family DNA-binding domain-containing protein [Deltaproteobacteria bacterium]|nr:AbrB/MazE/SpoVT family DNA-binding domain-containing protein [Deltaproteobacteria bacterium]
MMLVSKLAKIGKSWGVILPREVLEEAEIDQTATFELRVDQGKIVLSRLGAEISDPFALLRRGIPRQVTDKQVGKILDHALRRVRHAAAAQRSHR